MSLVKDLKIDTHKPIALDLFCGAGGATKGLQDAGFFVIGIDNVMQTNYCGDAFINMSVLEPGLAFKLEESKDEIAFIWASPPCQRFSVATKRWEGRPENHPDLVEECRNLLDSLEIPYVMENVPSAPLRKDLYLTGQMFDGLKVIRKRVFELSGFTASQPENSKPEGTRGKDYFTVAGHPGGFSKRDGVFIGSIEQWKDAMNIDWITAKELVESVPPDYSRYIAEEFKKCVDL